MQFDTNIDALDDGIRGWDILFDNIFTDWSVKNRIQENLLEVEKYYAKVEMLQADLYKRIRAVDQELAELVEM